MLENYIEVSNAPTLPGLRFRQFAGERDYPAMLETLLASERPEESLDGQLPAALQPTARFDPFRDILIAEMDGQMVGYGRIISIDEFDDERAYNLRGYVIPGWRRMGIGGAMLGWLEERAREIECEHPRDRPAFFYAGAKQHQPGLAALLERAGYRPARFFYVMVRPSLEDIPDAPLPAGLELRPVTPEHYRAIWNACNETAQEEWRYRPFSEAYYQEWLAGPFFQPDLWQIAWDISNNRVAGHVLTYIVWAENEQANRKRGYTEGIGVVRAWRKRGLATAMIARSLQTLRDAGMEESALVVDSANASGALGLYERCGFRVVERNAVCCKPLSR